MYIEWGISYSSSDCFLINIWEVPNFQQRTSEYKCVSKTLGTTPRKKSAQKCPPKNKRWFIEAKYQQQAALMSHPPKKKHTQNDY